MKQTCGRSWRRPLPPDCSASGSPATSCASGGCRPYPGWMARRVGGYQIRRFPDLTHSSLSSFTLLTKTFFLVKTLYRYSIRIFRDHENPTDRYPWGYRCHDNANLFSRRAPHLYPPFRDGGQAICPADLTPVTRVRAGPASAPAELTAPRTACAASGGSAPAIN